MWKKLNSQHKLYAKYIFDKDSFLLMVTDFHSIYKQNLQGEALHSELKSQFKTLGGDLFSIVKQILLDETEFEVELENGILSLTGKYNIAIGGVSCSANFTFRLTKHDDEFHASITAPLLSANTEMFNQIEFLTETLISLPGYLI